MIIIPHKKKDEKEETTTPEQAESIESTETPKNCSVELLELTDTLKRLQAEFENYKKRTDKEQGVLIKNANANLIREMLPVLDSFEIALKNAPEQNGFKQGMQMIYAQLFTILKDQGLRAIETQGQKFDPFKHEVMMVKETNLPNDTIMQEFQKGYMLNEFVLRHAKVMIAKEVKE